MTSRRDILLEEMGLAPAWRLRREDAAKGGQETGNGEQEAVPFESAARSPGPKVRHSSRSAQDSSPDERAARILRMDWAELKAAVPDCQACGLHASRNKTVFGVGDEQADWLLIGEAPGAEEDARGEPFVGQAGRLLDNMLAAVGLARGENVYIANVLKCRPPGNRNPEPDEVAKCSPHLTRQIALIQPKLILAMGRFAVQTLLNTEASIASLRGRLHRYQGVPLIVTYHPAYLLRSLPDKAKAWEDLCLARKTMDGLISGVPSPS
jgi:uracil-DNA glycosylase